MKIAINQPYIFPYIGYFQLLNIVDKFIVYDDVNFIKKGWVNRNHINVNGNCFLFTIPLENSSQNTLIKDIKLKVDERWKSKFLKTLEFSYKHSKFYNSTINIIEQVIKLKTKYILDWHLLSFDLLFDYLNIDTELILSSQINLGLNLTGKNRIISICKNQGATHYFNLYGGKSLYNKLEMDKYKIKLFFLKPKYFEYNQNNNQFIQSLSIIDLLMLLSPKKINSQLKNFKLT